MASFNEIVLGAFEYVKASNDLASVFLTDHIKMKIIDLSKHSGNSNITNFSDFIVNYKKILEIIKDDEQYKEQYDFLNKYSDQILSNVYKFCVDCLY